jgi:hypothetical protein
MNKASFLTVLLFSGLLSCHAQSSEERTVSAFNKIKVSGAVHVVYTPSDTLNVVVKGKSDDLTRIETRVENQTLMISGQSRSGSALYVYIRNNQLHNIETSGATNFKTTAPLRGDSLSIYASGASDLKAKMEIRKLTCLGDGAANLVLEGSSDYMEATVSGAASLKSYNLVTKEAVVVSSGAANAKVHVTDNLKATASSASDIKVKGDPKDVTAETSMAASITRVKGTAEKTKKSDGDTTYLNWKSKKILVIDTETEEVCSTRDVQEEFKHWRGFSMGVNGYMSPGGGFNLPDRYQYMDLDYRRSLNFQFNIIERQINIVRHNFKLVTGFGFDYHLYELANRTTLNADSSFTWGTIDSTGQYAYKKNKLRGTYLQVPLLFEFNTSNDPRKTFHIAFGVVGQFLISSRTKQVLMDGKDKVTNVRKDSYNMNPFGAKAHVNVGYRNWTFFGEYSLTPLFQSGKGPELYPFTAGIRVVPFT